ncbi:MAG: metallophosphatase [Pseudomonadota bacterium]
MPRLIIFAFTIFLVGCVSPEPRSGSILLTVVGSNDMHGEIAARAGTGGLETFSGYLQVLRDQRGRSGGAVVLIDAGDMWQGTLASNLSEGRAAVAAYNALGYDAAALGNHEFDFGPAGPLAIPQHPTDDPRGALKQRAGEARFPLLAANLVEKGSGQLVSWDNVEPSVLISRAGVSVGIVGVMTARALEATIAANVADLEVTPLAPAIEREARKLRRQGADLVLVAAHAGGRCSLFDNPADLSSCRPDSEIFQVARALPSGLVNQIIAGHVHQGIAHRVNGIAITSGYSNARAFGRVDYQIEPQTGTVLQQIIYPPQPIERNGSYEGQTIQPDRSIRAIAARAQRRAEQVQSRPVGVELTQPFDLDGSPDSALGNLFNLALYESLNVDVVIQNVVGACARRCRPDLLPMVTCLRRFPSTTEWFA